MPEGVELVDDPEMAIVTALAAAAEEVAEVEEAEEGEEARAPKPLAAKPMLRPPRARRRVIRGAEP